MPGESHGQKSMVGYSPWVPKELDTAEQLTQGFPGGSVGKESTCSVGDLGSISRLGRSLEKGTATHSSILAWTISWAWGRKESDTAN